MKKPRNKYGALSFVFGFYRRNILIRAKYTASNRRSLFGNSKDSELKGYRVIVCQTLECLINTMQRKKIPR